LTGSEEFRRKLLSDDVEAAKKWRAYATIVSSGVKA
jgi:hypothetical protein